ncbi:dTDP-4-dehydrorhamnose reductase [Pseudovibrio sp. SPO723]|uniref:dTDP-4-dehydrorhamnose reductase n=1 Tax=Nesiotobacter zosterae TaxID=392721 RepID=UPI0029C5B323|nr:dTDP-4-dehydrorhamnose reductase [Pseudovibrio sp. SPO723]MDX5593400.1 dTDP-4-dehydrorhamnose reductase [Pseudovibrio sp. SPO723]
MKIAVVGKSGQVAQSLYQAFEQLNYDVQFIGRSQLDLACVDHIMPVLDALAPSVLINSAAFTAVDLAEEQQGLAHLVNAQAPIAMAQWCSKNDCRMVHISTDYVFDGANKLAYTETDTPSPINAYGATKLAGEMGVSDALPEALILRCSWVHSPYGRNFAKTMLQLADSRSELNIVDDQMGCPTSAQDLADLIVTSLPQIVDGELTGLVHAAASGNASWADLAQEIFHQSTLRGLLSSSITVNRISSSEYPQKARRPKNSVLDCAKLRSIGLALPGWRLGVARTLTNLKIAKVSAL